MPEWEGVDCSSSSGDSSHYGFCNDSFDGHVLKEATLSPNGSKLKSRRAWGNREVEAD